MAGSVEMSGGGSESATRLQAGERQVTTVLRVRARDGREMAMRAATILDAMPGVRRVLVDEAGHTLVVRGSTKASALRAALAAAQVPVSVVTRANSGRGGTLVDLTVVAFLILALQVGLAVRDFGLDWLLLAAMQAGISAFVMLVIGAPVLRNAAVGLGRLTLGMDLALTIGAGAAWLAGAISMVQLEAAGQPYFLVATAIVGCGLLAHSMARASRAAFSARLARVLRLMPDRAVVERRGGLQERRTATLKRGQVIRVEQGARIPSDGTILAGVGLVDESTLSGGERPYRCAAGDAVLAGTLNLGEPLRVRVDCRPGNATVTLLARVAAEWDPDPAPSQHALDRLVLWGYLGVVVLAGVVVAGSWLLGRPVLGALETGLLVLAAGAPAGLAFAGPASHSIAAIALRRWGIWVRQPQELERAGAVRLLVIGVTGVVTEGVRRVLRATVAGGSDERRLLGLASAALVGSESAWAEPVQAAAARHGAEERQQERLEYQGEDGVIAHIRDDQRSHRVCLGTAAFLASQGIGLNPNFIVTELPGEPAAQPVFVAIDGHMAGAVWLTDPIRQTARSAVRSLRAGGIETCLMGDSDDLSLAQIAGTVETDSYVLAESGTQQVVEIKAMQESGQLVAMVGHPVRDAAGLAAADLSIGFGALNAPAAARTGFLVRDASVLLVAACFSAARTLRRRLLQSAVAAVLPMLAAVVLAMLGRLDVWVALILIGVSAAVVLANSLRMVRWRPAFAAGNS